MGAAGAEVGARGGDGGGALEPAAPHFYPLTPFLHSFTFIRLVGSFRLRAFTPLLAGGDLSLVLIALWDKIHTLAV